MALAAECPVCSGTDCRNIENGQSRLSVGGKMFTRWLQGTRITYQAPDTSADPAIEQPQGDPHGDEVLEGGADIPLFPEKKGEDDPPAAVDPPAPEPEPVAKPPAKDWRDKEMARRSRRIDEERARAEEAIAENKRLRDLAESLSRQQPDPAKPDDPPARQPAPTADPERRFTQAEVRAEAARIAEQEQFKRDFASAYEAGSAKFSKEKMDEAIGRISELGGLDADHLNMVLATDDPGKVLYELGAKPEEFQRIMELPFNRRVVEFTKMGLKQAAAPKKRSETPPPVEPLGGTGGTADDRYDDKVGDEAWFRAEEKRAAEHAKRKQSW
jgi:hypothetical protein